ncbi:MAG TPA: cardiolipin synthase [Vicinamibacterales bacterium]
MDVAAFFSSLTWPHVILILATVYAITIAIYLVMENRSPQSTFAWLFLLLLIPIGGLVLYAMFGRSWHAFSRTHALTKLIQGTAFAQRTATLIADQRKRIRELEEGPAGEYAGLATMLWASARAPLTLRNRLEILQNAQEKYPRLLEDLRAARHSIHLLYYEWASDAFTEKVAELLARKVEEGVEVRILYDPVGSLLMLNPLYVQRVGRLGIRMYAFSPLYRLHTLSYRNHRKIAVIDGRIGYSGGLNMTEKHLTGPDGFSGWRDTHARVVGEAVSVLQAVFATTWYNTTGESLFEERYFPEPDGSMPRLPIQVVSAGPDSQWKAIRYSYLSMIALARKHVYLQSPFLIPDDSLAEAMKTASLAGIDVQVMIAPRGGELSPAYRAGMTYAAEMARAGVRVLLYQGAYFHAKTVCVDSKICCIGSSNIDIRSFAINYETNLMIYDPQVTRELEEDFRRDVERCTIFSAREYERRPAISRFVDSTLRLCSPLI